MTPRERQRAATSAIGFVAIFAIYYLVAWGYVASMSDGHYTVLQVLIVVAWIVAIRIGYLIIESIAGAVAWRAYSRRAAIATFVRTFQAHNFPKREIPTDDFSNYSCRVEAIAEESGNTALLEQLRQFTAMCIAAEDAGMFAGMRIHSALNAALDAYSPKSTGD